uniref:Thymidylate synthase n=1 Tax=Rhabditophanes sp. KR3021 TaxID=114890 RepID=A0AC35TT17_9BILA
MVDPNLDELKYLDLVREVIEKGKVKGDRTGTGTLGISGAYHKYNLRDGTMPLLTTKRTAWTLIMKELLWFISGNTDSKVLSANGVKIWDANGSRAFLDNLGFTEREEGDLGPVYGFQWRHFGAVYKDCKTDYTGQGVDQLAQVIDQIKNDPNNRRIVLSAWNAADIDKMALPPCHAFVVFDVLDGELNCHLTQRSGDIGLGVPFNIASYALLTHMIAKVCGLKTGDFCHNICNAHIYTNHVDALKKQLDRKPFPFPTVKFVGDIKCIDDFTCDNIVLENYQCHPGIKMDMAV